MIILALDTTSKIASVCLSKDDELISKTTIESQKTHSEVLLPTIDKMLKDNGLNINQVDLFGVCVGPGSFTGVRVGVSLVKGLAFGNNKKCIPVSSIEALAENLSYVDGDFICCPVMDARRNQLYNALFRVSDHQLQRLCDDRIITSENLALELKEYSLDVYFSGDGKNIISKDFKQGILLDDSITNPNGFSVAKIAYNKCKNNPNEIYSDLNLSPVYLRASQAEREYKEKEENV